MLYEVTGNILSGEYNIICQQVNCQGVMGAGLAKQIRNQYPKLFMYYKQKCESCNKEELLGDINIFCTSYENSKFIINLFAQYNYGRGTRQTDYNAFHGCLQKIKSQVTDFIPETAKIAFPYKIGCGLAGGDWNIIKPMIEEFSKEIKQNVYIVRLKEN